MNAIETRNLTKRFDNGVVAVSGLTVTIPRGVVFGLLGPNGAGKTTTVRLLNGVLTPTEGGACVLGVSSDDETLRRRTATLAEDARMYAHLSPRENLRFFSRLYDMPRDRAEQRIEVLLRRMDLWQRRDDRLGTFSTGMRKRVFLARTLLHDPELLFLDEPTAGLDPEASRDVTDLIRELATEQGTSVLLCTHNLPLAERICDRFGFLKDGRLVAAGTPSELIDSLGRPRELWLTVVGADGAEQTERVPYVQEEEIPGIVKARLEAGAELREVRRVRPSLEEVYFAYVRENEK
jgi:ABC-2 type transport system ATP-binding protein